MLRGPLAGPGFRGHFSGHETFPLRHLWLRKAYDAVTGANPARRNLFNDPEAIITFGVGKNMVTSIRHWALTCSIIEETGEFYRATALGKFLFDLSSGRDPFMESPATIWSEPRFESDSGRFRFAEILELAMPPKFSALRRD